MMMMNIIYNEYFIWFEKNQKSVVDLALFISNHHRNSSTSPKTAFSKYFHYNALTYYCISI